MINELEHKLAYSDNDWQRSEQLQTELIEAHKLEVNSYLPPDQILARSRLDYSWGAVANLVSSAITKIK